jgi:hypothetical protein
MTSFLHQVDLHQRLPQTDLHYADLRQASRWFLRSGIQESSGGVARYYHSDRAVNAAVSNEITGYSVSALAYLHSLDPKPEYRDAAIRAARFLVNDAWDAASHTFPFEPGVPKAYFFDVGIIVRGLLAAWRLTGEDEFLARAREAALSLAFDFMGDGEFHPVISLPDKQPLEREPRWSRQPGCYQLKAALAWHEIGDGHASRMFESALAGALATHDTFLPGDEDPQRVMDRLHPYCYFLEALLVEGDRAEVRKALACGVARVASLLREIAPDFERSDACAQLLRVRLIAHHRNILTLDENAACEEASRIAAYQAESPDSRLDGGFWFGQKRGTILPFMNPVSTAFCAQALALWHQHQTGDWSFELHQLI